MIYNTQMFAVSLSNDFCCVYSQKIVIRSAKEVLRSVFSFLTESEGFLLESKKLH